MDCVNHPGNTSVAYCQSCGKALCAACERREPSGRVLCDPCRTAWQGVPPGYAPPAPPPGTPNPIAAAWLGLIPGVGAFYNGQFVKGFLHVIVFAILVSMSHAVDVLGLLVMAWIFYQIFDAYQTAKARRDGQPLPDPMGINELVNWLTHEMQRARVIPPQGPGQAPGQQAAYQPPAASYTPPVPPPAAAQTPNPWQSAYQQPPYSGYAGYPPPQAQGYVPPMQPGPWRRSEPIAAIVLIAIGVMFLLGQFSGRVFEFTGPIVLIALGVWLVIRRVRDTRNMMPPAQPAAPATENNTTESGQQPRENDAEGDSK